MIQEPAQLIAPVFALTVAYLFFYEGMLFKLGSEGRVWATIRSMLPMIDDEARDAGFYTSYGVEDAEHVGTLNMSRDDAVSMFKGLGFIDNPLAAHKYDWDENGEVASLGHYGRHGHEIEAWSKHKRFTMMAFAIKNQLHVTLFQVDEDTIRVTAHYERSPYNAFHAYHHFRGKGYDIEQGVMMTIARLDGNENFEQNPDYPVPISVAST